MGKRDLRFKHDFGDLGGHTFYTFTRFYGLLLSFYIILYIWLQTMSNNLPLVCLKLILGFTITMLMFAQLSVIISYCRPFIQ